jgi:hypothetical protein
LKPRSPLSKISKITENVIEVQFGSPPAVEADSIAERAKRIKESIARLQKIMSEIKQTVKESE